MTFGSKILFAGIFTLALAAGYFIFSGPTATHEMTGEAMRHSEHVMVITSEREYLEQMVPHHEEAIASAQKIVEVGGTLRPIRDLSKKIIESQNSEISKMKEWYQTWYEIPYENTAVYSPMMRDLSELSGTEADKIFLEDMILHHEAAVKASETVLRLSTRKETAEFANSIIVTQSEEIALITELLGLLPN
jgi:uncharacterized protein (DUF305 family)